MIYLDYSATTPVCDSAINAIIEGCKIPGNPNSAHGSGQALAKMIETDIDSILNLLGFDVREFELIPTSGATEANNLALKGAFERYSAKGKKHIITTQLEHSSITATLSSLQKAGAEVDFAPLFSDGTVDIEGLENLIREDTLMISIGAINSETGIRQPIEEIAKNLKEKYPSVLFHTDATQAIGKVKIDYSYVDMLSFSAHKFYCFKGIGGLIKRKDTVLIPQIKGGSSTTKFRSGTPCLELIHSVNSALSETLCNFETKAARVSELNSYLRNELAAFPNFIINSPDSAIPQILNFSFLGTKATALQHYMSENEIYISTGTACAAHTDMSAAILTLTGDEERAKSSVRISISYLTGKNEIDTFLSVLKRRGERNATD